MSAAARLFKLQGSEPQEGKTWRRNVTEYVLAVDINVALAVAQQKRPEATFHDIKNLTPPIHIWEPDGDFTDARGDAP